MDPLIVGWTETIMTTSGRQLVVEHLVMFDDDEQELESTNDEE